MLSPHKERKEQTTDTDPPSTPSKTIPLQRGLFANGIWHCNCRDRAPAVKLQTRNQGVNHGRWFYTCQRRPQSNQNCGFFLWSSDAEIREKCVLFGKPEDEPLTPSSSVRRSEPGIQGGGGGGGGLLTPQTEGKMYSDYGYGHGYGYRVPGSYPGSFEVSPGRRMSASAGASASANASAKAKARMMEEDEMDNPGIRRVSSFTDRLRRASGGGQEQRQRQERLESFFSKQDSPRKIPRTTEVTSPGKRQRGSDIEDDDDGDGEVLQTQQGMEQTTPTRKRLSDPFFSFSSPLQSLPQSQSFDICQTPTPTKYTNPLTTSTTTQPSPSQSQAAAVANLAHQAITLLENKGVVIARSTQEELTALLNRHEMKMQGVIRGRDMTRMALRKREEEVEWLRERVDGLEVELRKR